jgi:predicted metal-binding membrane protein
MFVSTHLRDAKRDRAILTGALIALAVVAWGSLVALDGSPYGVYLHHDVTTGPIALQAGLFTIGWTLMVIAMMLPATIPLVLTFAAIVGRRRRPGRLVGLLLAGYLAMWTAFGFAAWIADRGIHAAVDAWPWLAAHPQLIIGATLLMAGLWQFSPLRDRCLEECRSPLGFVMDRRRGQDERRESFLMGVAHGLFCVGCCWSLMLVMFGVGIMSVPTMLVLGGLTAVERNLPQGRRLTRPVGVVLILAAVYAVAG